MNDENVTTSSKKGKVITVIIILGIIAVMSFTGIASSGFGLRIGWKESTTSEKWEASYKFFAGTRQKKINISGDSGKLHLNIKSTSGNMSVEVKNEAGEIIYSGKNLESVQKDISVSGDVRVKFTAIGHGGSFFVRW